MSPTTQSIDTTETHAVHPGGVPTGAPARRNRKDTSLQTAPQIELRWPTARRENPRIFRKSLGFRLGANEATRDLPWDWLFNAPSAQPAGGGIATVRFYTGENDKGAFCGIVAVGQDACQRLSSSILQILPAMRELGVTGQPAIEYDQIWIRPDRPQRFRAQTIVLTRVRGDVDYYRSLRADPEPLRPFIADAISGGINRQAERLGLDHTPLTPEDVIVEEIGELGSQPVLKGGGEGMVSRLTQAIVTLPRRLNGDWRVGGLLTYGNGRIAPVMAERHYRQTGEQKPYPRARMADNLDVDMENAA